MGASTAHRETAASAGAAPMRTPIQASAAAEALDDRRTSGPSGIRNVLETTGLVVAPTTLLTALAFYFGWALSSARALYFGIDPSTLAFSTQDYLLRSTDALFVLLGAIIVAALAALSLHVVVSRLLHDRDSHRVLLRASAVAAGIGAALLILGIAAIFNAPPFSVHPLLVSLSPGIGIAAVAYALHIRAGIRAQRAARPPAPDARWLSPLMLTLVAFMVVLSVFWTASEYAQALGRGSAQALEQQLSTRPSAVVFSRERLHLSAPGVTETRLAGAESAYGYRYDGLRLLVRSGGNYFLLPDEWSRENGVAVLLPDTDDVRLEFGVGR